ncbi:amidohydrolase [Humisphaera borealis]|uniref:Amidohydrolase n=1 Tax=Humisphaera borealis TaxID=2807512 RepID=A0A7M2WQF7_9BACT|nr:amidohydrolase [Humisphaera borealis]QOV87728.1 amidohydrolase [Humisphaera borealis]
MNTRYSKCVCGRGILRWCAAWLPGSVITTVLLGGSEVFADSAAPTRKPVEPVAAAELLRPIVDRETPALEKLYQSFHASPELSLHEKETAHRLAENLKGTGFEVTTGVGGHGVVAVLKNGPGKTLLIRADLDALPVREESKAAYASTVTEKDPQGRTVPVMHACGHDIHMTVLVGTAKALVATKDRWSGTLVLIGQPAEEIGHGAAAMLSDGLYTRFPRPDIGLALHVDAELEAGKVGWVAGFSTANVDSVDIVVRGVGGHGAQPQSTKDPVVIAAQIVLALQTIRSREVHPREPVVVTVGSIQGGTKHNIIPDSVTLQLTIRTYKDDVRAKVLAAVERISKGIAIAAGVPKELEPVVTLKDEFTPALYNSPELVQQVKGVFVRTFGEDNVVEREPTMGGEDFARYGKAEPKIPIFMFRLGSVPPAKMKAAREQGAALPSLHSSKYLPDSRPTLETGVTAMTAAALDLLKAERK